jgi:thiamine kinase-like enzyme
VLTDLDRLQIERLPCWKGNLRILPLSGGMTNRNYRVDDDVGSHVVRLGHDLPHHGVDRAFEQAVCQAAHAAGLSPAIEHAEPGVMVMAYVDGRTLEPDTFRDVRTLAAVSPLIRRCHQEIPPLLNGPARTFCPFESVRRYAVELRNRNSPWNRDLDDLLALNDHLERGLPPSEPAFGHNDLLAGNLIDDGRRLWLIDWDYAAYSRPLFDLANLATNNALDADLERVLLESYLQRAPDAATWQEYRALRVASLLRETFWSLMSELLPTADFDYAGYTRTNLARLDAERRRYERRGPT